MDAPNVLMSLDDRVAHIAREGQHGVTLCGEPLRDPWQSLPGDRFTDVALFLCGRCFEGAHLADIA